MLSASDVRAVTHHRSFLAGCRRTCLSQRYLRGKARGWDQWSSKLNPSRVCLELAEEALNQRLPHFVYLQPLSAAVSRRGNKNGWTWFVKCSLKRAESKAIPSFFPGCTCSQGSYLNAVHNATLYTKSVAWVWQLTGSCRMRGLSFRGLPCSLCRED